MIEKKTVLVLGAGASKAFGFPIGKDLKNEIYLTLKNRSNKVLNDLTTPIVLRHFIKRLQYSPEESIDAFLEHEKDNNIIEFGKMAIAAVLLPYEKEETLFNNFTTNKEKNKNFHWYQYLWNQMKTSFDDFEKNLSIITFNYDRSLEYYLYTVLKHKYPGKKDEDYKNKLKDIPIIHIYGKLGFLPWECAKDKRPIPYNFDWDDTEENLDNPLEIEDLIEIASQKIKIVHEDEVINKAQQIREILNFAERIYFLGFGFNPINLQRLIGNVKVYNCDIRGTMYEMTLKSKNIAREIIKEFRPRTGWDWDETFPNKTIREFLFNHVTI